MFMGKGRKGGARSDPCQCIAGYLTSLTSSARSSKNLTRCSRILTSGLAIVKV